MRPYNLNDLWCKVLVQEVVRAGARHAVLCAGGRAAALLKALIESPAQETIGLVDERAAAFIALGVARASGRPAVVATTSGSAVANLTPALVEAHASGIPLILLTADRPRRERGAGGPQYCDHMALTGG